MHRPTLVAGFVLLVVMCLIPPVETGPIDDVTSALRGEEVSNVEYRPIWSHPEVEDGAVLSSLREWEIAGRRLLLQIVAVIVVTLGLAYTLES